MLSLLKKPKLTLSRVQEIVQIPKADRIEIVKFKNAQFIHRKGFFSEGDWCLVLKSGLCIPNNRRKQLRIPKDFLNKSNNEIKKIKLLGKVSNCYAVSISTFINKDYKAKESYFIDYIKELKDIADNSLWNHEVVPIDKIDRFGFVTSSPFKFINPRSLMWGEPLNNANIN